MKIEVISVSEAITEEDILQVVNLADEIWRAHYIPILGESQVKYMLEKFQSKEAVKNQITDGQKYFLIYYEKYPAGYFSYIVYDTKIFLSKLYILKKFRRRGIAENIINGLFKNAVNDDKNLIYLYVNKRNLGSIAFYENMGFRREKEIINEFGGGFTGDDYLMEKKLK